ncbi:hypothetical protein [Peribacillus deserti]|uniref:Uncharacterized protein n=1 Tax=Peribacillus deserti TaxID=673318 RepID=A0A2N5M0H0_9BACI|nr:hypothetical protein [Peribacillus deserti]PLT27841.1 hypothetical protein CUU66_21610 [Peribacillus deserti]
MDNEIQVIKQKLNKRIEVNTYKPLSLEEVLFLPVAKPNSYAEQLHTFTTYASSIDLAGYK